MTTRLKRKLGDLGVDLNSRRATENFCLIGTPLPPLEKSKDTGEFVPLWKQDVRDEKGRRRLHGAFTGGFSAGYFNSVGSKEGWTPSTFVSSRTERAKKQAAKPEDFMDEEDLQELKDSRTLVSATGQNDLPGGPSQQGAMGLDDDPVAAALQTTAKGKDSAGAKILKKMGWRQGQGIGPRVSLAERKRQDAQAFDPYTGIKSVGNSLEVGSDDEEAGKHTYPRRDTPVLNVRSQNKRYGLGYSPGLTLIESLGDSAGKKSTGPKISAGFGLGALNDADEDDIDIYDAAATSKNRTVFEHGDHERDDTITIGKGKGPESKPIPIKPPQTFYGGAAVLPGFTLSDKPVQEDQWYAGPEIPPSWKPDPRRVWDAAKSNEKDQPLIAPLPSRNRAQASATERGALLGEAPAAAGPRSVFDFMSEKDRERIKRIAAGGTGSNVAGTSGVPPPPGPGPGPAPFNAPRVEPEVAKAALRGFQPFTKDPAKQARYNTFLQSQANDNAPALLPYPGQSPDEFNKELEDYAKAAVLFKPMTGAMAGRFTSAAVLDLGPKIHEGLHQPTALEYLTTPEDETEGKEEEEKSISPKAHAARMGMYGPLTRETQRWAPARLLCKRFGVKEPDMPVEDPVESSKAGFTPTTFEKESAGAGAAGAAETEPAGSNAVPSSSRLPRKLENIGLGDDETQGADILTYERPAMDIFKAIFASDEENSDGEDEKDDNDDDDGDQGTGQLKSLTKELKLQDNGPVDLATFKPTFIPREGKAKASGDKERSKDKKDKKKKEKKAVLVSFQLDEGGEEQGLGNSSQVRGHTKKKRKDKAKRKEDNDVGMFIDQPPDQTLAVNAVPSEPLSKAGSSDVPRQNRKRAIDFLDE